jgi:gamma-glutamyltranspeptidase
MADQFSNAQQIRKPAVTSKGGIVAAQSRKAAEVGAEVLAAGATASMRGRRALGAEHLAPACTAHFSVVDREGNMAAVTQTLLSTFGSKFVLPQSGVMMNNGIMWFDPTLGGPNSLAPGKRCLTN